MTQTELASANRVAFLGSCRRRLPKSTADLRCRHERRNRSEAAPRPADGYGSGPAVARLYRQDGVRTGDIVNRTRALIKESAATEEMPGDQSENASASISIKMRPSDPTRL